MQRNHFIDVLKGILIIGVIVLHFPLEESIRLKYLFPFWLNMMVPCFMFITGYVYTLSFKRREITSLEEAYKSRRIFQQMIRYISPFTLAFIAEWVLLRVLGIYRVNVITYGPLALCMDYLRGGKGMGSYYFPLMIQCVVLFPVIYFVIKKYQLKGLLYCLLGNAFFEVLKTAYSMNETEYRLLIFRYLFIMAAGCYFAMGPTISKRKSIVLSAGCMVVGLFFCYLFGYTNYTPKILTMWSGTSFLAILFLVPVLGGLITRIPIHCYPLELIGKASFHIFLVQMIYYALAERIYELLPEKCPQLLMTIIACVGLGILFYWIEKPITKWLVKMVEKHHL